MNTKFLGKGVDKPHQEWYNKEKRKEVDTMTITRIEIITYNGEYTEDCYGLVETVDRMARIQECDNVIGVQIVSMETGEILYYQTPVGEVYVAPTLVVDLMTEVLG